MGAVSLTNAPNPGEGGQYGVSLSAPAIGSLNDRHSLTATSLAGFAGTLLLTYFRAPKSLAVANASMWSATVAAGATPTLVRYGQYVVDPVTGNLTLAGASANDTTIFGAVNTQYTRALVGAVPVTPGAWYAHGMLIVTAAAMPAVAGYATVTVVSGPIMAEAPRLTGALTGQVDLPASIAAGSITPAVFALWAEWS